MVLYPIGTSKSCVCAAALLKETKITLIDHPAPEVTHLLLDIPSFSDDGSLRGGGDIGTILSMLPPDIWVIGGNLQHPALAKHRKVDLLQDARFLARNAAITADCALKVIAPLLDTCFSDSRVLIIGWGRIGKSLGFLLRAVGCSVTIAARKDADRAMAEALGFGVLDTAEMEPVLSRFTAIFNTVPEKLLPNPVPQGCIAVELASRPGLTGDSVVMARGLPGKYAPVSTGRLIADRILSYMKEGKL